MAIHPGTVKTRGSIAAPALRHPWAGPTAPAVETARSESLAERVALFGMIAIEAVALLLVGWFLLAP